MRLAPLAIMLALNAAGPALAQAARPPSAAPAAKAAPAIGCPSLSNLRILMRQNSDDLAAAAALLADPKADHLGCVALSPDKVTAVTERVALTGHSYECVGIQGTSVCHWTRAGTAIPVEPGQGARPQKPAPARR